MASDEVRDAAQRVGSWLDANWKYISDDLARDLRLLVSAGAQTSTRAEGRRS